MRFPIAACVLPLALVACRNKEVPGRADASVAAGPPSASANASANANATATAVARGSGAPSPPGTHCQGAPPPPKPDDPTSSVTSHDRQATVWSETDPPAPGAEGASTHWLCFERGGKRKVLLQTAAGDGSVETGLVDFQGFVFSRDDRVVFFTTDAWAVSRAAHGVEVATGKEYFITDGNIIEELERGPYKGSLYASHYRLDEDHPLGSPGYTGRGVVTDIIDWHGQRLAKVPDGESEDPKAQKERKRLRGR